MTWPRMESNGPLRSGTMVGQYTVVGRLGEGGMGAVYRARDPKLKRDVAIKLIRSDLAGSPERHARFEREAQILASLSHPNIAAIYGLDNAGGTPALVMELVEGPSLADRLRQGPMPIDDALRLAGQIAEALEYAHERGIVHRDLKPGNIKLTTDGAIKILDFGLAKAVSPESAGMDDTAPTVTGGLTEIGAIVGTPAYMSPEQATGRTIDRRTDVWAFGCVLFEMLAGTRPFGGESATDTIAGLLGREPNWSALPAATPLDVHALLRRCLRKDPRQRLQAIGDARIILDDVRAGGGPMGTPLAKTSSARRTVAEIATAAVLVTIAAAAAWYFKPAPATAAPLRSFTIVLPAGQRLAALDRGTLAFSDDGGQLAYVAAEGGVQRIYVRAMDTGATTAVAGTEGATTPFFSPDGQWLGFFSNGRLKKIPLKGGPVASLTDVPSSFGATWAGHTIVFASLWSVLQKIDDAGTAAPRDLTQYAGAENSHAWPRVVPDREAILFSTSAAGGARAIAVSDLSTGAHHEVVSAPGVRDASYAAPGHVIYLQPDGRAAADNLMAVPVDVGDLRAIGEPAMLVPGVRQYAISATGSLAYVAGPLPDNRSRFVWVSRTGVPTVIDERAAGYYQPRLDPVRGDRIVTDLNGQVWLFDIGTRNATPFTFGDLNQHAIWGRDGRRLLFMTQKGRTWQLSSQPADGSSKPEAITSDAGRMDIPYSLTPDGALAYVKYSGTAESQLWVLPRTDVGALAPTPQEIMQIPIADAEAGPAFSPDGHWLAYAASDGGGHRQIYVQAYPGPGGKHQVSIDGGNEPLWNPDRSRQPLELFYRSGDDMMAVDIDTRDGFEQGKPRRLFSGAGYQRVKPNYVRANYDVSPDGQRFLMLQPVGEREAPLTEIHVVLNWASSLANVARAAK